VLHVEPGATSLERADFAIGCFWGAELAYQREPGVIATKVGYTQGKMMNPTYEQVCSGSTGHTECVQVMYDPKEVTYARLCDLFWERLGESRFLKNQVGNDRGTQYRHGIYWHSDEQKQVAETSLAAIAAKNSARAVETELANADKFWNAEDYHMQYLQKGGQDARKAATETIRCYG
jgi:peptide-methionine (S)-S-oxide reductase